MLMQASSLSKWLIFALVPRRRWRNESCGCPECRPPSLLQLQVSEAIANLSRNLHHFHFRFDHQLAGECLTWRTVGLQFVRDATILTFLVPAKAAHGQLLWNKVLHRSQQHVAFGHPKLFSQDFDGYEFVEGTVQGAGRTHEVCSF